MQFLVRNNYNDHNLTIAEAALNEPDNLALCMSMFGHANRILMAAGWKGLPQVREEEEAMRLAGGEDKTYAKFVVQLWMSGIIEKHGALSLEAKCASFALHWEKAVARAGDDIELLKFMADLCEASFWMQFELMDYHHFVMEGSKAKKGRAASPIARTGRKKAKNDLTEQAVREFLKENPDVMAGKVPVARIVAGIFDDLNKRLESANLEPYRGGSLRNAVGPILSQMKKDT